MEHTIKCDSKLYSVVKNKWLQYAIGIKTFWFLTFILQPGQYKIFHVLYVKEEIDLTCSQMFYANVLSNRDKVYFTLTQLQDRAFYFAICFFLHRYLIHEYSLCF